VGATGRLDVLDVVILVVDAPVGVVAGDVLARLGRVLRLRVVTVAVVAVTRLFGTVVTVAVVAVARILGAVIAITITGGAGTVVGPDSPLAALARGVTLGPPLRGVEVAVVGDLLAAGVDGAGNPSGF